MQDGLVFGWRTAILAVVFLQLLLFSIALVRQTRNRSANRTLAAWLVILAGMITPWMIGFAGFYDQWLWLSFAPFAISLAIAPLAYLYIRSLIYGRWTRADRRHLLPACVQFVYLSGAFVILRQPFKNDWLDQSAFAYDLITGVGVVAGLIGYGVASRSLIQRYGIWLSRRRSDDHRFALAWAANVGVERLFISLATLAKPLEMIEIDKPL